MMATAVALRHAKDLSLHVESHDLLKGTTRCGWPLVWDTAGKTRRQPHMMTRETAIKLIEVNEAGIKATPLGTLFLRHLCARFDAIAHQGQAYKHSRDHLKKDVYV